MKFVLVDRIDELESRRRIVTRKALSLAEEYLADHFPTFPVLPGVFMLEAMVQSAAWLVREALDFRPTLIVLADARNVTYKSFLAPGRTMQIEVACQALDEQQSAFQGRATVEGREIVKGKLKLRHLCLADQDASLAETDDRIRARMRSLFTILGGAGGHATQRLTPAAAAQ